MKKLFIPVFAIFGASCAQNIPSQTKAVCAAQCDIIYGQNSDWDNISDDLARNIYRHNLKCEALSHE